MKKNKSKRLIYSIKSEKIMKSLVKDFINLPQYRNVRKNMKGIPVDERFSKILHSDTKILRDFLWFMLNKVTEQDITIDHLSNYCDSLRIHELNVINQFQLN